MKELPPPHIYEDEFKFWPWGKLIDKVVKQIVDCTPDNGRVLDLMCGPGYLLQQVHWQRKDIQLYGIDIDPRYVMRAIEVNPSAIIARGDVFTAKFEGTFDVVTCTGGTHHLPYDKQPLLLDRIAQSVDPLGCAIVADPHIRPYRTETERSLRAAELGHANIDVLLAKNAPDYMVQTALDVLSNDIFEHEWKTPARVQEAMLRKRFGHVEGNKVWPTKRTSYGDYYFTLWEPKLEAHNTN